MNIPGQKCGGQRRKFSTRRLGGGQVIRSEYDNRIEPGPRQAMNRRYLRRDRSCQQRRNQPNLDWVARKRSRLRTNKRSKIQYSRPGNVSSPPRIRSRSRQTWFPCVLSRPRARTEYKWDRPRIGPKLASIVPLKVPVRSRGSTNRALPVTIHQVASRLDGRFGEDENGQRVNVTNRDAASVDNPNRLMHSKELASFRKVTISLDEHARRAKQAESTADSVNAIAAPRIQIRQRDPAWA